MAGTRPRHTCGAREHVGWRRVSGIWAGTLRFYARAATADSGAGRPAGDGLDLEEVLDPPFAAFAPVARLLHAAEGRAGGARLAVHLHHARAQRPGEPVGPRGIAGLDVIGQPVGCVVGNRDAVLLVIEGNDRQDRAEDFLAR